MIYCSVPLAAGHPSPELNMKLPILLCVVTLSVHSVLSASVEAPVPPGCELDDGVIVNGFFHKNEVLAQGLNRPYQLSYHEQKREIFFSNNVGSDKEDKFEIKRLLHDGTLETIEDIENGFATAICDQKEFAYFGGSSGIYRMRLESGNISKIIDNYDVWDMFYKKHLYFIQYSSQKLYKVKHQKSGKKEKKDTHEVEHEKWIHEEIYQFAIDGDDDIFITNKTGLFIIKNGTQNRIHISGETVFRAIEINDKGEAHFVGKNGIYVLKKPDHTLHLTADIKNTFGLTFDNDEMIYSNPLKIIKLKRSECKNTDVSKAALL